MTAALTAIEARKEALVAECAMQRATLAEAWRSLETPAARGKNALGKLRSPWLWLGLGLVLWKLPLKRFVRVPVLLFKGWQMAMRVHSYLK